MMRTSRALVTAFCFIGLVLCSAGPVAVARTASTQQPETASAADLAAVERLLASAEDLLRQRERNSALPVFERALEGARRLGLAAQEAQALCGIGEIFYYATQYADSRARGTDALAIYERLGAQDGVGRASHLLSMVEEISGNIPAARTHADRAIAAYDMAGLRRGRAMATLQLLRVGRLGLDAERPLYARAIDDARAVGDRGIESRALHSLGDHLFTAGLYEESLDHLTRAATLGQETGDLAALGTLYNSLGRLYRAHGRLDEALKFQRQALELHQKAGAPLDVLQSLNAVATVYQRMGDLASARTYYERALALAEKSSSQRVQDLIRANFASLLLDRGEFASGAEALERVIANGLDNFMATRYASLSFAYVQLARPQDALKAATDALEKCARDDALCSRALARRAVAESASGDAQAALSDVNASLQRLEAVRSRLVPIDFFRQDFHRAQEDIYSLAIKLQSGEKQDRLALETAELARSRAFLDLLATRDVQLKEKDEEYLAMLRKSGGAARTPAIALAPSEPDSQPLALTLRGGGESRGAPAAIAPRGTALELRSFVAASPSAANDLMATAARLQSTIVSYWVAEDELFAWVITPEAVHARRIGVLRSKLIELVRSTSPFTDADSDAAQPPQQSIRTRGASTVALRGGRPDAWRALYDILIEPIRALLPRETGALLTIVPQGPLLNLSFAALQSPRGRYLLEDYALHYAPAGGVLQFTEPKRRADARSGAMLVVADPTLPRLSSLDRPLPRLPGARSEAAAISRLVPRDRLTLLQDAVATESRARTEASSKAVVHFATHAIVSDDDPFGSYLALGPTDAEGDGDGRLTAEEVYRLDLHADLVVLSACRSAGGRITGDGITTFARAFIYAGTASLVASLWDVADEPTNRLLPAFYRAWRGGTSKSGALRAAQLGLLRDLRAGRVRIDTPAGLVAIPEHPVFWAGFALFGEPD